MISPHPLLLNKYQSSPTRHFAKVYLVYNQNSFYDYFNCFVNELTTLNLWRLTSLRVELYKFIIQGYIHILMLTKFLNQTATLKSNLKKSNTSYFSQKYRVKLVQSRFSVSLKQTTCGNLVPRLNYTWKKVWVRKPTISATYCLLSCVNKNE